MFEELKMLLESLRDFIFMIVKTRRLVLTFRKVYSAYSFEIIGFIKPVI